MAVGVGIVGLSAGGGWAANAHVPALAALDGYERRALGAWGYVHLGPVPERYVEDAVARHRLLDRIMRA